MTETNDTETSNGVKDLSSSSETRGENTNVVRTSSSSSSDITGKRKKRDQEIQEENDLLTTLSLPTACIARICKNALPEKSSLSKDAKQAIARATGIFVLYLASTYVYSFPTPYPRHIFIVSYAVRPGARSSSADPTSRAHSRLSARRRANDYCKLGKFSTVKPNHVFDALNEIGFVEFRDRVKACYEAHENELKRKKESKRQKVAKDDSSKPETGGGEGGGSNIET